MAYLLTQIVSCLLLAIIAGAAIGWLLNGYRAATREKKIKAELMRQSLALSQAETDNKMIEEDYRDLKFRSEETIAKYAEENKLIPVLDQNLEKSQALVRQMLQNHQTEVRNLSHESEKAKLKLRELENREKAVTRLQMDLNTERLQKQRVTGPAATNSNIAGDSDDTSVDQNLEDMEADTQQSDLQVSSLLALKQTQQELAELQQAELQLDGIEESQVDLDSFRETESWASRGNNLPSEKAYDELSDVVDTMLDKNAVASDSDRSRLNEMSNDLSSVEKSEGIVAETANPSPEVSRQTKESDIDYGQSDRNDELQRIFGIGPVTEKTLRSMGISSFEQIANFTTQHIEHVAKTLEIFPGRIRRDNWVESARKLLAEENDGTELVDSDLHELEDA